MDLNRVFFFSQRNYLEKLDQFPCLVLLCEIEVDAFMNKFNIQGVLMCVIFKDELLHIKQGLLVLHLHFTRRRELFMMKL